MAYVSPRCILPLNHHKFIMNPSVKNGNAWNGTDPFERLPAEDFADLGLFKAVGLNERDIRYLVRTGVLKGHIDSKNEISLTLHAVENFKLIMELASVLDRSVFVMDSLFEGMDDREVLLLEYLLHKLFRKPITISNLKKAFE